MALGNQQYESIMRGYEQKQDQSRREAARRREQVYSKVPDYRRLEDSVSALSVSMVKEMLSGSGQTKEDIHASLKELSLRKKSF